jgi:hypothetical protein
MEQEQEQETRPRKRTYLILIVAIIAVLALIFGFFYGIMARQQSGRFPEKTYINGIDVGGMTATRAKNVLANQAEDYALTIRERNGVTETITAEDIGLAYVDDGEVDALLAEYDPSHWLIDRFRTDELTAGTDTTLDAELADQAVRALDCFRSYTAVQDAQVALVDNQFVVQPEVAGNQLDQQKALEAILAALNEGDTELDLEEAGLYLAPTVYADDAQLNATVERLNGYLSACLTFDFGDDRIVTIDASVIGDWVKQDEDGNWDLDYDTVYDFVKTKMAYKVDTFGLKHTVTTHSGVKITLSGGDYGWCLARGDTTDKIIEAVKEGRTETMEPEWLYKGKNLGYDDIGGTYVEISISEQMMWCYKNYELVVETPVVTGNISKGYDTPYGSVWAIDGMKRDAVLGTLDTMGYASPVSFWMPFTGNVGIHDADGWRSSYGGEIYKTNGSHGCVNTPYEAAKTIFETISVGTAVVVYDLSDENTVVVSTPGSYETPVTDENWDWDD